MKFWLLITSANNWEIIRKKNVYGAMKKHRTQIESLKKSDKCLIYLRQEFVNKKFLGPYIVGLYEVISGSFEDNTRIFNESPIYPNENYPFRVNLKPVKIFSKPIEFKSLIPNLGFITNKRNWASHMQGRSIKEIPENDFNLLISKAD
jgi:predicted RNA-binding protein